MDAKTISALLATAVVVNTGCMSRSSWHAVGVAALGVPNVRTYKALDSASWDRGKTGYRRGLAAMKAGLAYEARADFGPACRRGHDLACGALGILLASGLGGPADKRAAGPLLHRGCNAGLPRACGMLGTLMVRSEPAKARVMLQAGCADGQARACVTLADMWAAGAGGPKSRARAEDLRKKSCNFGDGVSCRWLAGRQDSALVTAVLHRRACDLGDAVACYHLAARAERAEDRIADLTRACDLRLGVACARLAEARAEGGDRAAAAALAERGCSMQSPSACERWVDLTGRAEGAAPPMIAACDRSEAYACLALARWTWAGKLDAPAAVGRDGYGRRACELGARGSCDELAERLTH